MFSFLFIDSERVWRGGQAQLLTLIEGLFRRGHKVHLVCYPGTSLEERARNIGISVHPVAIRSEADLISLLRLIFVLRNVRPDILAFNTPKPILIGNLASRFARVGARIIFRRVVFPLRNSPVSRFKYTWNIDCILAISRSIKLKLIERGVPASLIKIVYEGIDLSPYPVSKKQKAGLPNMPIKIGTISHLSPEKGLKHLIEAAALVPDVKRRVQFIIVGDGDCRTELQELVRKKGLDSCFQFLGFRKDTRALLKDFDLFVLPSLSEGLSSAIMEAMATSLPIIGSDVGGIPELVQNGVNGLLVPPADPEKLAGAIQQMLDNPEARQQMGLNGRKRVEKDFTLDRKILETEKLCHTLLSSITTGHTND